MLSGGGDQDSGSYFALIRVFVVRLSTESRGNGMVKECKMKTIGLIV